MDAVLENYETAPISESERALLGYIEKVNRDCASICQDDIEALHRHGLTDQAMYDAIMVCGLFNFYNRWIDASGVHEMSPLDHARSGHRLATRGYE